MKRKVIIYSEIDWGFLEQRHHFIARRFRNEGFEVVFFQRVIGHLPNIQEILVLFKSYLSRRMRGVAGENCRGHVEAERGYIDLRRAYFLPPLNKIFSLYNFVYWTLFHKKIQADSIVYSFSNNPWVIGSGRSKAKVSIFDIIHNWWSFPWHKNMHAENVERSVNVFDYCISDSVYIQRRLAQGGYDCRLILPGAAPHWFSDRPRPDFTAPRPCFFGNLRGNSDLELVLYVHELFELKIFGRVDVSAGFAGKLFADAEVVANDVLPDRLSPYNTIVLPYADDEFSSTIAPAKYFEALATGMLLLTRSDLSHLPGADEFVFRWCTEWSEQEFLQRYGERLIKQGAVYDKQRVFARAHSWDERLDPIIKFVGSSSV